MVLAAGNVHAARVVQGLWNDDDDVLEGANEIVIWSHHDDENVEEASVTVNGNVSEVVKEVEGDVHKVVHRGDEGDFYSGCVFHSFGRVHGNLWVDLLLFLVEEGEPSWCLFVSGHPRPFLDDDGLPPCVSVFRVLVCRPPISPFVPTCVFYPRLVFGHAPLSRPTSFVCFLLVFLCQKHLLLYSRYVSQMHEPSSTVLPFSQAQSHECRKALVLEQKVQTRQDWRATLFEAR